MRLGDSSIFNASSGTLQRELKDEYVSGAVPPRERRTLQRELKENNNWVVLEELYVKNPTKGIESIRFLLIVHSLFLGTLQRELKELAINTSSS